MKPRPNLTPLVYSDPSLTASINLARIFGGLRSAVPSFRVSRVKRQRLAARLHGIWKR